MGTSAEPIRAPDGRAPRSRRVAWATASGWLSVYLALCAVLHRIFVPVPHDADTAYHVAVARLIRDHGILTAFPWTPFSWLAENYADKELVYHLLIVPFTGLEWTEAAAAVGTIAGAAMLATLRGTLAAERVPYAGLWAVLPLVASSAFVFRFALVRPHVLSIALAVMAAWAAARGRLRVLAAIAFAYPWFYVAWQLPVVLVATAEGARALSGERLRWRPLAVACAGLAAGLLLHPNGWNLVRLNGIVLWDVLVQRAWGARPGLELGDEFQPFTLAQWSLLLTLPAALAVASVPLAWRRRREDPVAPTFAIAALLFGVLTLRTARFTEYFVPFSAMAFALGAGRLRRPGLVVALALTAGAAYSGRETSGLLERLRAWPDKLSPSDTARLQARIPPGAQVFTCEWGLTGRLMLALPERRFVVALDPTLFAISDPERYDLWYRLPREATEGAAATIRERFGARYVACFADERFEPFVDKLLTEPGVTTVLLSSFWSVYELRDH